MGSISGEDDQFFHPNYSIASQTDSGSDDPGNSDSESRVFEDVNQNLGYGVWIRSPMEVSKRREKLFKFMGLAPNQGEIVDSCRVLEDSGAVLISSFRDSRQFSHYSTSCCSNDSQELVDRELEENSVCRIRNLDNGLEFIVDELGQDGLLRRLREVGSNQLVCGEELDRIIGSSPLVQRAMRKASRVEQGSSYQVEKEIVKKTKSWLQRLGIVACISDSNVRIGQEDIDRSLPVSKGERAHNIKVRTYRKRCKEFSALYMGQDIVGHKGAILTMKFNPDGEFLASAGEDGVIRVWQVMESQRSDSVHISDFDTSKVCFMTNHLGELSPVNVDKEKGGRLKSLRRSTESTCVIFPQKVFQLAEKPLHEFIGHRGEILDLSWSHNKCLLSSSDDNTVRLWRVGYDHCLKVFSHTDFVTSIQFNSADENYFISGSVDGKVRIWAISRCEVVDWTDVREIVTAVCYQPDGKGAIVGSISGDCYFYNTSDNRLKMTEQTSLHGKKKTPCRRITGFQFSPGDPSKLMVTTADSQVRILKGVDVIRKYKGLRNGGSQISASFSSDGKHIISASEDSLIYVWGSDNSTRPISSKVRTNWSCERFYSSNASVAIPWCKTQCANILPSLTSTPSSSSSRNPGITVKYTPEHHTRIPLLPTDGISLAFSDPFSRVGGVATWPEEKLTSPNSLVVSSATCKSEYKLLKTTCQNMAGGNHAWGSVIVTAGLDGRIRVFQNYGLPARL